MPSSPLQADLDVVLAKFADGVQVRASGVRRRSAGGVRGDSGVCAVESVVVERDGRVWRRSADWRRVYSHPVRRATKGATEGAHPPAVCARRFWLACLPPCVCAVFSLRFASLRFASLRFAGPRPLAELGPPLPGKRHAARRVVLRARADALLPGDDRATTCRHINPELPSFHTPSQRRRSAPRKPSRARRACGRARSPRSSRGCSRSPSPSSCSRSR